MTTDPAIISSHIAVWRPIGHDPPHARLVKIDSATVRKTSDGARARDRATLVMICVLWTTEEAGAYARADPVDGSPFARVLRRSSHGWAGPYGL
jgi:hypothetical protein